MRFPRPTRTILLKNSTGEKEFYCPTPAQPPWLTEKPSWEAYRDRKFAAMPFSESEPPIVGNASQQRIPGRSRRWTWTYILANKNGLTRHFLRRDPYGNLQLKDELFGHTYRILGEDLDDTIPAEPSPLFPEKPSTKSLLSVHCAAETHANGHCTNFYYVANKLPNGAPQVPATHADIWHALRKRDGSWCFLPKSQATVPESWQPGYSQAKPRGAPTSEGPKPMVHVWAEKFVDFVGKLVRPKPAKQQLPAAAQGTNDLEAQATKYPNPNFGNEACTEVRRSGDFSNPNKPSTEDRQPVMTNLEVIREPQVETKPEGAMKPEEPKQKPNYKLEILEFTNYKSPQGVSMISTSSLDHQITRSPDHPIPWSWTAIDTEHNGLLARHFLRCSPEGKLLLKEEIAGQSYTIAARNVDRGCSAEPSPAALEEARAFVQVQFTPTHYAAASVEPNGAPYLPPTIAAAWHVLQKPDGSWCILPKTQFTIPESWYPKTTHHSQAPTCSTVAQPPPPVGKDLKEANKAAISQAVQSRIPNPNSGNPDYPLTNSPTYPISSPVDTIDDLESLISSYLVCTDAQRTILALWILHTYIYKSAFLTPYLNISSPIEESGKSTCMTILRSLCARPWWAAGVSPSMLKLKITADHPTVLLDNWHTIFRGTDKQQMTGFLLSGCDSGRDLGSIQYNSEDNFSADDLQTFCPKAFAGMDPLPPTLARRSIPIVLQRRKPQERVKSAVRLLAPGSTRKFTSWMQGWAKNHIEEIKRNFEKYECESQLIHGLSPHQQNSSKVLIALAETIGGQWPRKARAALLEIFHSAHENEGSPLQLLSDIRDAFARHGNPERLFTAELLHDLHSDDLHSLDHSPWYEWGKNGKPINSHALARILHKSFKIHPRWLRRSKEERLRGYQLCDFIEPWERYLPDPTSHLSQENRGLSQCPTSNTEPIEANAAAATAKERKSASVNDRPVPARRGPVPPRRGSRACTEVCRNDKRASEGSKGDRDRISANKINPCHNVPLQNSKLEIASYKLKIPPMSQFKKDCQKAWTKSTSLLKDFASKAIGITRF